MNIKQILIYGHEYCAPCRQLKKLLSKFSKDNNIEYKEIDTLNCSGAEEAKMHALHIRSVPYTIVTYSDNTTKPILQGW